jgi:hypothetical protein
VARVQHKSQQPGCASLAHRTPSRSVASNSVARADWYACCVTVERSRASGEALTALS